MSAILSPCGTYRYLLSRIVGPILGADRVCLFVMLNPSTADAEKDDPTIRRCRAFALREGCTTLEVVNLFALRATDPRALYDTEDPVGPENNYYITRAAKRATHIVAAWGAHGSLRGRGAEVLRLLGQRMDVWPVQALGFTKGGHPRHPLYVRGDAPLVPMEAPK